MNADLPRLKTVFLGTGIFYNAHSIVFEGNV